MSFKKLKILARILVNTRFLIKDKLEGIGRFTYETLKRLTLRHPEHQFFFLFDRQWDPEFVFADNVFPIKIGPQARHPLLWYWWFEHSVPNVIRKVKPDVFLSTDGFTTFKTEVKKVTVFHDLAFEHYPKDVSNMVRFYYKSFTPGYTQVSDKIATVSQASKDDLVKTYNIDEHKIDVVYNGASDYLTPISEEEKNRIKSRFTDGNEYFCFVGALQPRKNVGNLFKAFDNFKKGDNRDVKLVIVGRKAWKSDEIFKTYESMKFKNDVIFTGHLKHEELKGVYGASIGLVYIPYFEGFGIPIIEAQQCGCPVITSNVSCMPEVAGAGALLVDPFNVDEIVQAMINLQDTDRKVELIDYGYMNCERFSWDKTAEKLWQTIEQVL